MTDNALKIGLDFHGVINERPEYFALFTQAAIRKGYEIHVITGGPLHVVQKMLDDYGVKYTQIFAILDYYDARGEVTYFANGEYKIPDELWDTAKAEYCSVNGINLHIDDSSKYVKWFLTPYCHYNEDSHQCETANNMMIDFNTTPLKALKQIEAVVEKFQFF